MNEAESEFGEAHPGTRRIALQYEAGNGYRHQYRAI